MVLARIRQLSAPRSGIPSASPHFAASPLRSSLGDGLPAPLVKIRDGKTLDLSDAYFRGIGVYDVLAVR